MKGVGVSVRRARGIHNARSHIRLISTLELCRVIGFGSKITDWPFCFVATVPLTVGIT